MYKITRCTRYIFRKYVRIEFVRLISDGYSVVVAGGATDNHARASEI